MSQASTESDEKELVQTEPTSNHGGPLPLTTEAEPSAPAALLPCPFCGSTAELERDSDHHGEWFNLGCSKHWGAVPDERDRCPGGRIWYTEEPENEASAIEAWNRRAEPRRPLFCRDDENPEDYAALVRAMGRENDALLALEHARDALRLIATTDRWLHSDPMANEAVSPAALRDFAEAAQRHVDDILTKAGSPS